MQPTNREYFRLSVLRTAFRSCSPLDLQGRLVLAPAKQDEEQPRLVDAAAPNRLFDAVRARRLVPDESVRLPTVFLPQAAIGFKSGICDEKALVPWCLDNFQIPRAA